MKLFLNSLAYCGLILSIFVAGGTITSCSDDISYDSGDFTEENFTGIRLLVSDVEQYAQYGATRADGNDDLLALDKAREGRFNTLYIVAVDDNNNIHVSLKNQSNGTVESSYSQYFINLKPGRYKFYVVANLNRYLFNGDSNTTFYDAVKSEQDIRNLILNFISSRPLEAGFLPMACLSEEIRMGNNAAEAVNAENDNSHTYFDEQGFVKINEGENPFVYADLSFLVSKIRYTILYNQEKGAFAETDVMDVHRSSNAVYPFASKIRKQTAVDRDYSDSDLTLDFIKETSADQYSTWPITLDRYLYDSAELDFYAESNSSKTVRRAVGKMKPWTSEDGSWTSNDFLKKRAWQGVAYLPENLDNEFTQLSFPYSFNGAAGAFSPREIILDWEHVENDKTRKGIKRGNCYDVVVLIKTPDPETWSISVIPSGWSVQELGYQLHGPYELVVEASSVPLSMEEETIFWFRSDVPPGEIGFISPQVSINNKPSDPSTLRDIFIGEVLKDANGQYMKNENGDYLFRVALNVEIPYNILSKLNTEEGITIGDYKYTKKDISFFHIVAGSLKKRIEVSPLNLDPYLSVSPQTIIIDTRELYTSGDNNSFIDIRFETNVDVKDLGFIKFYIEDPNQLIGTGKGDGVLRINPDLARHDFLTKNGTTGVLNDKKGEIRLDIQDIITGNPFWNQNNEFTLNFILEIYPTDDEGKILDAATPQVLSKTVAIKVRPFSGNYVIHFRDNTKDWEDPHIYVYQLLTLPSDLPAIEPGKPGHDPSVIHDFAGKIVGFIERNPSSGLQWNAAVQYVFSNNLSFKGWKGYGGPDINDPWQEATVTYNNPSDANNSNKSTMGFVMFGKEPDNNPTDGCWNYSYAYNKTEGLQENSLRTQRYNYDVNFNSDHEISGFDKWGCQTCKDMSPDFNGRPNDRFYTGISMEREADGWWKYTLTGVAQPGRTMIIFANYHAPWTYPGGDYAAEDNRWPGDYETGLPLFDFEDNEGWFLFDGNTTNSDQKFSDDKPSSKVIPYEFSSAYTRNMRIEVKKPSSGDISSITIGGTTYSNLSEASGKYFVDVSNPALSDNGKTLEVSVGSHKFKLSPKNFKHSGNIYVTAQPLFIEFDPDMNIFVKWNDNVSGQGYNPPSGGNNSISVYWASGQSMKSVPHSGKEYGNYKYNTFNPESPASEVTQKDKIQFRLLQKDNSYFTKDLSVEDIVQYYNPEHGYFQINVHKLP